MCERLKYENEAYEQGYSYIIGLDEAGRGPMLLIYIITI